MFFFIGTQGSKTWTSGTRD